jgi:hypothetical protein
MKRLRFTPMFLFASLLPTVTHAQVYNLNGMEWKSIGSAMGGRSLTAAGTVKRPNEYYFGATGGGLWKTTDSGTTWNPVTDGKTQSSSVGAVAVSELDPNPNCGVL